jgi:KaiC/GvpD/RAD55 family RecA-like ATPase
MSNDIKIDETTTMVVSSLQEDVTVLSQPTEMAEVIIDSDIESTLFDQMPEHGDELEAMPLETISADNLSANPITPNPMEDTPMTVETLNAATGTDNPNPEEDNPMTATATTDTTIEDHALSQDDTSLLQQSGEPVIATALEENLLPDDTQDKDDSLLDHMGGQMPSMSKRTPPKKIGVVIKSFEEVVETDVRWLLKDVIPMEEVTVISGNPGEGKSSLTCWLAAAVSRDQPTYFRDEPIPQGVAIFCNTEDTDGNIKKRLRLNGANMKRVMIIPHVGVAGLDSEGKPVIIEQPITLDMIDALREVFQKYPDCKVLIIDPISARWGNHSAISGIIAQLKSLAVEFGVAIVLVTHLNKSESTDAFVRTSASKGLLAAARAGWLLSQDETELRTVSRIKLNVSESKTGFSFRIIDGQICDFDYEVDAVANDMLQEAKDARVAKKGKSAKAMHAAADWLYEFLRDGEKLAGNEKNPVPGSVRFESKAAGHAWSTLRKAERFLKVLKNDGKDGLSYWSLPDEQNLVVQNAPSISPQQPGQADDSSTAEPLDIACPLVQGEGVQEVVGQAPAVNTSESVIDAIKTPQRDIGQINRQIWKTFLQRMNEHANNPFKNVKPDKTNWLTCPSGHDGISYLCKIGSTSPGVELYINRKRKELTNPIFNKLKESQKTIASKFKVSEESLEWNPAGYAATIRYTSPIHLNVLNEDDRDKMIEFFVDHMPRFEEALSDELNGMFASESESANDEQVE